MLDMKICSKKTFDRLYVDGIFMPIYSELLKFLLVEIPYVHSLDCDTVNMRENKYSENNDEDY